MSQCYISPDKNSNLLYSSSSISKVLLINSSLLFNLPKHDIFFHLFKSGIFYIFLDEDAKLISTKFNQFFANIYLNEIDQYVKRVLKIKYYVRYMNDFIFLLKTKEECIKLKKKIGIFLDEHLVLKLNDK